MRPRLHGKRRPGKESPRRGKQLFRFRRPQRHSRRHRIHRLIRNTVTASLPVTPERGEGGRKASLLDTPIATVSELNVQTVGLIEASERSARRETFREVNSTKENT